METVHKNDFIEIEFTGIANGNIFDTTNKEEAKKIGLDADVKPLIVCVGNEMLLKGFDDFLEEKEINKKYSLKLSSEKAFGNRNPSLIKTIPIKVFHEQKMNPAPGMTVQLDDYVAKILSVSGGRVIVDFNNPLAGKDIEYDFIIKRKVDDDKEKVNSLQDFFFRMRLDFDFKTDEKNPKIKKVIFKNEKIKPFLDIFNEKFKTMTGLEFSVEKDKKEQKSDEEEEKNENTIKEKQISLK